MNPVESALGRNQSILYPRQRRRDTFEALVAARSDGKNDLQLIVVLYDHSGKVIEIGKKSTDATFTSLTYSVPFRSPGSHDNAPRQFTMMIRDISGSFLAPNSPPRVAWDQSFEGPACPEYYWGLRALSPEAETTVAPVDEARPRVTATRSGSRGPSVSYTLPLDWDAARTSIRIFDIQGRLVRTLLVGGETAGQRTVSWDGLGDDGGTLPSGIYFARVENPTGRRTTKLVLTR